MGQKQRLLLVDDVDDLGRKGEIVEVKNGFARNFLLPQRKATFATKHTLRMQTRLQEERAKKATEDRSEAELLSKKIDKIPSITLDVNVDPEGKLYGSVSTQDISSAIKAEFDLDIERKHIKLAKPIKETGTYDISIVLNEGVESKITLIVKGEGQVIRAVPAPVVEEIKEENSDTDKPASKNTSSE